MNITERTFAYTTIVDAAYDVFTATNEIIAGEPNGITLHLVNIYVMNGHILVVIGWDSR